MNHADASVHSFNHWFCDCTAGDGEALIKEVVTFNGAGVGSINGLRTLVGMAGKAALQGMESAFNTLQQAAAAELPPVARCRRSIFQGAPSLVLQAGSLKTSFSWHDLRTCCRSLAMLLAFSVLAACASSPMPVQQRTDNGHALFEDRCKNVAGIKIYKTIEDVEGIVLLKVRPVAGDRELADPMWPGAAFAGEWPADEYIDTFLWYENPFGNPKDSKPTAITPGRRGFISSAPSELPGYRYVDVVDEKTGTRERYSGETRDVLTHFNGISGGVTGDYVIRRWILDHQPAPAEGPRYGVTFEDHVIPEERALGLASSTVKVLDLKTHEVLGEMTRYAWTPAKPNSANPTPWLTAYTCGSGFNTRGTHTRLFVDQILQPRKDK